MSLTETLSSSGSEIAFDPKNDLDAPYFLSRDNEAAVLNGGSLQYTTADISLPGKNGFDLVIQRCYNSMSSNSKEMTLDEKTFTHRFSYNIEQTYTYYLSGNLVEEQTQVVFDGQDEGEWFGTAAERNTAAKATKKQYEDDNRTYTSGNVKHVFKYAIQNIDVGGQQPYGNKTRPNDALLNLHGLGYGWRFNFPSIESIPVVDRVEDLDYYEYLYVGDGRCYRIRKGFILLEVGRKSYALQDITLATVNGVYNLSYKDGRVAVFDANKRLHYIQDRFGNKISFAYSGAGRLSRITDSFGRTLELRQEGVWCKWVRQDNNQVLYSYRTEGNQLLESKDAIGCSTKYGYSIRSSEQSLYPPGNTIGSVLLPYHTLTSIIHPTNAVTFYSYEMNRKHVLSSDGYQDLYLLASRQDTADGIVYNRETYTYQFANDKDPDSKEYTTFISEARVSDPQRGLETLHKFSVKSKLTDKYTYALGKTLPCGSCSYTYDSDKLMISEVASRYNLDGSGPPVKKTTKWEYTGDRKANPKLITLLDGAGHLLQETAIEYNSYSLPTKKEYYKDTTKNNKLREEYTYSGPYLQQSSVYQIENGESREQQTNLYEYTGGFVMRERQWEGYGLAPIGWPRPRLYRDIDYTYDSAPRSMQPATKTIADVGDADGNPVSSPYGAGICRESFTYDWFGRTTSKTDPNGNQTLFERDALGRVTKEIYPGNAFKTSTYDDTNNITRIANEEGCVKRYEFTPLGKLSKVVEDVGSGVVMSQLVYDTSARLEREESMGPGGVVKATTIYTYDCLDRVVKKVTQQGSGGYTVYLEKFIYDDAVEGNYAKETKKVTCSNWEFPIRDRPMVEIDLQKITTAYKDVLGRVVRQGYVLEDKEYQDTHTYDSLGNKLTTRSAQDAKDGYGNTITWAYYGYAIGETNALGQTRDTGYDGLGQKTYSSDYNGRCVRYEYDNGGRMIRQGNPFSPEGGAKSWSYYDMAGNLVCQKVLCSPPGAPQQWRESVNVYDARGRVVESLQYADGEDTRTSYVYDKVGNKLRVTVGGTATTVYTYDRFGNVLSITDPMGKVERYTYDATGVLQQKTDRNGNRTAYTFDCLDRLLTETVTTPAGETQQKSYVYNHEGTLHSQSAGGLTITYRYDLLDRLTCQSDPSGAIKEFSYDLNGNRTSILLQGNNWAELVNLTYTYDRLGRLETVREKSTDIARYTYDKNGNRQSLTYPQIGIATTYQYNYANLVTSLENKRDGAVVSSYSYAYYLDGNQSVKTDHTGKATHYVYDGMGRLARKSETGGDTVDYGYDRFSNRSKMQVSGADYSVTTYTYDLCNHLELEEKKYNQGGQGSNQGEDTGGGGNDFWPIRRNILEPLPGTYDYEDIIRYQYDANGNQVQRVRESLSPAMDTPGTVSFAANSPQDRVATLEMLGYNGCNQLIFVYKDNDEIRYFYRPDGLRHKKSVLKNRSGVAEVTVHEWDGQNIVADEDENGGVRGKYLRGMNLIAQDRSGTREYYLHNAHGDVVGLADQNGNIRKQYDYDVFGVEKNSEKLDSNPFRYCGEYWDKETGTLYLRNRHYNPAIGRFTSEDVARSGLNWYTYASNNPIMFIDPTGMYDRVAAVQYAATYAYGQNQKYLDFGNLIVNAYYKFNYGAWLGMADCANFVSQALYEGGDIAMNSSWYFTRTNNEMILGTIAGKPMFIAPDGSVTNQGENFSFTASWSKASTQYEYFSNPDNGFIKILSQRPWKLEVTAPGIV